MDHSDERYQCEEVSAEQDSCDFDLCSDCARKNNEMGRKNECFNGHQLYPIKVNSDGWRWGGWRCNGGQCGYIWRPDQELGQDVVWRCQHDFRKILPCSYTGTTLIEKIPWGDCPADEDDGETSSEEDSEREDWKTEDRAPRARLQEQ